MSSGKRIYYLDTIKTFLTVLVILHHVSITYGGAGSWYFIDGPHSPMAEIIFTVFTSINQSYFMGYFFLIAAYFSARSLSSGGSVRFIFNKLIRLGIPLLLFNFIIGPVTIYFARGAQDFRYLDSIHHGPLWFMALLLCFDTAFLVLYKITKPSEKGQEIPSNRKIFISLLFFGVGTFCLRLLYSIGETIAGGIQPAHLLYYVLFYIAGVRSFRYGWLDKIRKAQVMFWGKVTLIALIGFFPFFALVENMELFFGGFSIFSLVASLWDGYMAMGIILGSLYIGRTYCNRESAVLKQLARSNFTAYVLHAPVVTLLAISISSFAFPAFLKFFLLGIISVTVSYLLGMAVFTKIPLLKKVF